MTHQELLDLPKPAIVKWAAVKEATGLGGTFDFPDGTDIVVSECAHGNLAFSFPVVGEA